MKKRLIFITAILIGLLSHRLSASDLIFPKTEDEITKILSHESVKTIEAQDGSKYMSEDGKVYKIIGGNRFRLRGIQVIEALAVLPIAGALINFDFDSSEINQDSYQLLNEFGKAIKHGLPDSVIMIAGHTDSRGSDEYNRKLSEKRAKSVADYLMLAHGISPDQLIIKGFGEKQPIAQNDTEEHRLLNRRVEFIRIE